MNRRSLLSLVPLSAAGFALTASAGVKKIDKPLGMQYLQKVDALLEKIFLNQSPVMLEASYRMAEAVRNKRSVNISWDMGHSTDYDLWPGRPGVPDFFTLGIPDTVKKGDVILADAYNEKLPDLSKQGAYIIGGPRPWGGDCELNELLIENVRSMKIRPFADLWIDLYAHAYGGIINVPGEIAPMGPVSGVTGMLTFWMMMADMARILARDGIKFKTTGESSSKNVFQSEIDTDIPAGQEYYSRVAGQLDAVKRPFDTIEKIAAMAVHSVLTGGRVYVYSRYHENLCAEGTVRRGGLGLTFGISGPADDLVLMDDPLQQGKADLSFKPTGKDMIIMGINAPDSDYDIEALDVFKKAGTGIAVIGPNTRNGIEPDGRSVPKEADYYVGSMIDSEGIFTVPGMKGSICPTSGLINNQIFWSTCCQIAHQIVERTGNAPGIYLSGALKGGMEKLNEVKRVYKQRGY